MADLLDYNDIFEAMITASLGPRTSGIRAQVNQNQRTRGNTPLAGVGRKLAINSPAYNVPAGVLWIVDRLIEPQTIAHFLQFAAGTGDLPGGQKSAIRDTQPSLEDALVLIQTPPSSWAPAPFNTKTTPFIHDIMTRIGSLQDGGRMQCISKDLHFLKSRLWEGIMPLSDAAWRERGLDLPANFPQACQLITGVVEVFQYLDEPRVRDAMRTTYNLIYDHLLDFERAVNAKRAADAEAVAAASSDDKDENDKDHKDKAQAAAPIQIAALWVEYMTAHFAHMETRAHAWVTGRIESLSQTVLNLLRTRQPLVPIRPGPGGFDEAQWCLTDMWQDLMQNQACADMEMFVPIQGFKGMRNNYTASGRPTTEEGAVAEAAAQDASGDTPLPGQLHWAHPDIEQRARMYHGRRRELQMRLVMRDTMADLYLGRARPAGNDPETLAAGCEQQAQVQKQMRLELRGVPYSYPETDSAGCKEPWVVEARGDEYNVVVYRGYHGHDDDQWNKFVEAFEADANGWGKTGDVQGASDFRAKTSFSWRNVADEFELGEDVEVIKVHFREELKDETPAPAITDFFLLADKASIDSYLNPPQLGPIQAPLSSGDDKTSTTHPKSLLAGDVGGFILAIDATFDPWTPADDARRAAECPGYKGSMRVRSSLIWDDLVPGYVMQSQLVEDLWPMARVHPREMYVGPVVMAQLQAWGEVGLGLGERDGQGGGGGVHVGDEEELARMMNDAANCVPS